MTTKFKNKIHSAKRHKKNLSKCIFQ